MIEQIEKIPNHTRYQQAWWHPFRGHVDLPIPLKKESHLCLARDCLGLAQKMVEYHQYPQGRPR